MPPSTPQDAFFSNQDIVSPDINLCYTRIIKDIDAYRSKFNGMTINLGQTISLKDLDALIANNDMNSTSVQESRCHTFYRMIGFPVVSGDGARLYSPGFDPDLNRDPDRISENLDIASSSIKQFKKAFDERELHAKNSINVFQNKDATASAMAIASIYSRPFDKQFKEGLTPLEFDSQTFNVPDRNFVVADFSEDLDILSTRNGYFSTRSTHILKPFIVDPRVELTVTPAANRICAPFLTDKSKTQLSRGNYLKRPYIERVMRVRFNNTNVLKAPDNQEAVNQFVNDLVSFIQDNSEISNPTLVEITADSLKSLYKSELIVFSKFIKILEAFVLELAKSFIEIERIRKDINWKPIPNSGGPEFGSELNAVNPADNLNNKSIEVNIMNLQMHKFLEETDFDLGLNEPDLGNFSFSNVDDIVFGSLKNVSQFYDKQLSTLNRRRDEIGTRANELLRNIEIITGEFSGLGLLDVIAIQAALWIISPEALVALIDDAAITRMQSDAKLKSELTLPGAKLEPLAALTEFEKKVSEIYVLIGAFYQDVFTFGGKNRK